MLQIAEIITQDTTMMQICYMFIFSHKYYSSNEFYNSLRF